MAICYRCKEIFYGDECDNCGWIANYKCFNCKNSIIPMYDDVIKCICGWFQCPNCETCGCGNPELGERPFSNEEKRAMAMGEY